MKAVEQGRFRSDLYYRLNQINISVPSLRERKDDIPLLFRYFCSEISEKYNIPRINLSSDALTYLSNYPWRGNIRELKNIAERISLLEMDREIDVVKLKTYIPPIESLPVPIESGEYYDDKDDIIRIILQNKKDIEELKEEVHKLKSVVIGLFNSSSSTAMLVPPTEEEVPETVIDYPEETVKKEESVNLRELEKKAIIAALERNGGKRSAAAKELGFSERTLYRKMIEYDLNTKR